jgi:hypothetical protein
MLTPIMRPMSSPGANPWNDAAHLLCVRLDSLGEY